MEISDAVKLFNNLVWNMVSGHYKFTFEEQIQEKCYNGFVEVIPMIKCWNLYFGKKSILYKTISLQKDQKFKLILFFPQIQIIKLPNTLFSYDGQNTRM